MKQLFYNEWANTRVNKIINIFGKKWFNDKKILELGAAHGDIGIELLKIGAHVCFSDGREENLQSIVNNLEPYNYKPDIQLIDQNTPWSLDKTFDLVLHLGTLWHIENWKQDLERSLSHSNVMILETMVNPRFGQSSANFSHPCIDYGPLNEIGSFFTQEAVEEELTNLGCKFIRFDDPDLNTSGWAYNSIKLTTIYDWEYNDASVEMTSSPQQTHSIHHRRFWLVLK